MEWVKEKGFTPTGVAYEFYGNDPTITPENEFKQGYRFPWWKNNLFFCKSKVCHQILMRHNQRVK